MPRVPAPIPDPPRCVAGSRGATNCYLNGPGGPRLAGTVANADQFAQLHAFKIVQILRVDAARLRRGSCRPAQVVLIVDAGPLYAAFDADERHHAACRKLLERHPGPLLVRPSSLPRLPISPDRGSAPKPRLASLVISPPDSSSFNPWPQAIG